MTKEKVKRQEKRKYLTEKQAAEFLGISDRTLRAWRTNGQIDKKGTKPPQAYVKGIHIYYELGELYEWIREGAVDGYGM